MSFRIFNKKTKKINSGKSLKSRTRRFLVLSSLFAYVLVAIIFLIWEYHNQKRKFSVQISREIKNIESVFKEKFNQEEKMIHLFIEKNKRSSLPQLKKNFYFFNQIDRAQNTYYIINSQKTIKILPSELKEFFGLDFSNILGRDPYRPKVYQSLLTYNLVLIRVFPINKKFLLVQEKDLDYFSSSIGILQSGISNSFAVLIDGTGRMLYHPRSELVKIRYNFFFDLESPPNFNNHNLQQKLLKEEKYFLQTRELFQNSQLYLIYLVPASKIYSAIFYSFLSNLIIAIIVVSIIFLVIHYVMNRYILRPISSIINSITTYNMLEKEFPSYEHHAAKFKEFNRLITAVNYTIKKNNSQSQYLEKSTRKLLKVQDYLYHIFNALPLTIFIIDKEGNILNFNASAREILKHSPSSLYNEKIGSIFPELNEISKFINESHNQKNKSETKQMQDFYIPSKKIIINDNIQYFNLHLYPFFTEQYNDYLLQMENITEKIQLDEMSLHTEKMKTLGSITSGIAHELNNPLGIINQNTQNAIRRLSPEIEKNRNIAIRYGIDLEKVSLYIKERGIAGYFEEIRLASQRAGKIIRNMLNFSRDTHGEFDICNPGEVINETIRLIRMDDQLKKEYSSQEIQIEINHEKEDVSIHCIRIEIQQVLLNIIKNAIQAIGENKSPIKKIFIETSIDKVFYQILIRDNGPGIDESIMNKIFNPFFSTKEVGHGTGLGLSVSYYIITNHHKGKLTVSNHSTGGAAFKIQLPIETNYEK